MSLVQLCDGNDDVGIWCRAQMLDVADARVRVISSRVWSISVKDLG